MTRAFSCSIQGKSSDTLERSCILRRMVVTFETGLKSIVIALGLYSLHMCVIIVHEAGHAFAAEAVGFECIGIRVGPVKYDRPDGIFIRFRWSHLLDGLVLAQFRSIPEVRAVARAFGMFSAGPVFSLLFCGLAAHLSPSHGLGSEVAGFTMIDSGLVAVLTLNPGRKGITETDGYKMWTLAFRP